MNLSTATNSTEKDITHTVELWMYGIILPLIAVPGVFANLASVIVFTRKTMRSSINLYLAGLGCFDCCLLMFGVLLYPLIAYCAILDSKASCMILNYSCLVTYPLTLIAHFCSVWTCVALTLDRYLAVKFPLRKLFWCTAARSTKTLIGILIFGVVYCIPTMFELQINPDGSLAPSALRISEFYATAYKAYTNLAMQVVIPWVVMIYLNLV
ncbi:MAG: G-protein coupled receptor, partial [Gammaproteobacteria bacterium]|nr:G-protein coupled receptor [Gammaproteobacteria bacterium]